MAASLCAAGIAVVAGVASAEEGAFDLFKMNSATMLPTLAEGDVVSVDHSKLSCGHPPLQPGDVVLYPKARAPGVMFMHRLIAGRGATVEVKNDVLWIDGRPVKSDRGGVAHEEPFGDVNVVRETLANGVTYSTQLFPSGGLFSNFGPLKVPAGSWFIMGDNRDNVRDSRDDGPVPESNICFVAARIVTAKDLTHVGKRP